MTAGTKTAMLAEFRSHLNFVEGPNNDNPFAAICGHPNHRAWCDSCFVACAIKAGIKGVPNSASCQTSYEAYKAAGRLHTTPEVGDQGLLWFHDLQRYAHTGCVEALRPDGRIVQLEGNTDVAGGRTGGRVMRKVRNPKVGMVFGRPLYVPEPKKVAVLPTATLHVGMGPSQAILNVQKFYAKLGNKIMLDGRFTPQMQQITRAYQEHRGLPVTGAVDTRTLTAIRAEIKRGHR